VAQIRGVGTAMFLWLTDQTGAAAAGQNVDAREYPLISREELEEALVPRYIQKIPELDGWGHPYEYYLNFANHLGPQIMLIRSPGRDGKFSATTIYSTGAFAPGDFDADIVWADGFLVRWPRRQE